MMKSVKPGRGPSFLTGFAAVMVAVIGVFWTIMVFRIGAPVFLAGFGVLFVILSATTAVYNFANATRKNRFSAFDITSHAEEPDPLNERFGPERRSEPAEEAAPGGFCPYCGAKSEPDHDFCRQCGKRLD